MGWQYEASGTTGAKQTAAFLNRRDAGGDIGLTREQLSWVENPGAFRKLRKKRKDLFTRNWDREFYSCDNSLKYKRGSCSRPELLRIS